MVQVVRALYTNNTGVLDPLSPLTCPQPRERASAPQETSPENTRLEFGDPGGNLEVRSTISMPLALLLVELVFVGYLGNRFNINNIVCNLEPIFP